jgi:hypothetical protein
MEDRWESWGDFWNDDLKDDDDVIHVVISTDIPMVTLRFLAGMVLVLLNDITDEDNPFFGKFIVVTDNGMWARFYHELAYPE